MPDEDDRLRIQFRCGRPGKYTLDPEGEGPFLAKHRFELTPTSFNTAKPPKGSTRVVPLGGLGEIGMNCLALEQDDGILILDCGVTFPDDDRGVDLLHPDFSYLLENRERIAGVFITHGHEDHIGALPYLLSELEVPVWAPAHALALIRRRLRERAKHCGAIDHDLRTAVPRQKYSVGPFEVEPIRVSHSIIEATALSVRTAAGVFLHTGDFKFDPQPADGEPTDEERLEQLGDEGITLLLSDSTNAENFSQVQSEAEVADALEELIAGCQQRVVVGLFSSNVQRLINLGEIAKRHGRRIGLLGRSLRAHVETACHLGHLCWGSEHRVLPDQLSRCPPSELLLLAGGTQAEAGSGLARLARGSHYSLKLSEGDRVILSSRIIPGNARKVSGLMSDFLRLGVQLHSAQAQRNIHASGHATRDELSHMLQLTRPECFIPVHGTRHHLQSHCELASDNGVDKRLVLENGETAWVQNSQLSRGEKVKTGRIYIDRGRLPLQPDVLRERADLGRNGLAQLVVMLNAEGEPIAPARLLTFGLPGFEQPEQRTELARETETWLRRNQETWRGKRLHHRQQLERFLGYRLEKILGRRPQVRAEIVQSQEK